MMSWLMSLLGRHSNRKEKNAAAAEVKVEDLEVQAIEQQQRLDAATRRVAKAVEQVQRVEQIARGRHR